MNEELKLLIDQIRTIANKEGLEAIALDKLNKNSDISNDILYKYFSDDKTLAEKILEDERSKFEVLSNLNLIDHINPCKHVFLLPM